MRICSVSDLKNKEVICLSDGARLGYVSDAEFDLDSGLLVSLTVPFSEKLFSFSKCEVYRILWADIERIGDDVILVRTKCRLCEGEKGRKHHCSS